MTGRRLRGWGYLALTVVLEVVATLALRASDGFTALAPSLVAIVAYAATVVVLSLALKTIPMSTAYVIWTAAGTAGVVAFSVSLFGDQMTAPAWAGIVLVIVGVGIINAFPDRRSASEQDPLGENAAHSE